MGLRVKHGKKQLQELFMYAEEPVLWGNVVKVGNSEATVVPCGDNEGPLGVCERTVSQSQFDLFEEGILRVSDLQVPVTITGITGVKAGGTILMNQWVRPGPNGTVVTATLDETDHILGICLDACAEGENTHIQLQRVPQTDESVAVLLLEDGNHFLLENGGFLLLE